MFNKATKNLQYSGWLSVECDIVDCGYLAKKTTVQLLGLNCVCLHILQAMRMRR